MSLFAISHAASMARLQAELNQAGRAEDKAAGAANDVRMLAERIDKLTLICQAMWALIREKTNLTEQDLEAKVNEIDLQDGTLDGKLKKAASKCEACGRVMSRRHTRCLYCGEPKLVDTVFDGI